MNVYPHCLIGEVHGRQTGEEAGWDLGYRKGVELGQELGQFRGRIGTLLSIAAAYPDFASERCDVDTANCHACPRRLSSADVA